MRGDVRGRDGRLATARGRSLREESHGGPGGRRRRKRNSLEVADRGGSVTRPLNPHADEAGEACRARASRVWTGRGLAALRARDGKAGAGLIPRPSPRPPRRLGRHTLAPAGPGRAAGTPHTARPPRAGAGRPTAAPGGRAQRAAGPRGGPAGKENRGNEDEGHGESGDREN